MLVSRFVFRGFILWLKPNAFKGEGVIAKLVHFIILKIIIISIESKYGYAFQNSFVFAWIVRMSLRPLSIRS